MSPFFIGIGFVTVPVETKWPCFKGILNFNNSFNNHLSANIGLPTTFSPTPYSLISSLTEIQSFNQILYTTNDFDNTPPVYRFGEVEKRLFLSAYDGLNGNRANKTDFTLTHENTPIYTKTFDPTNTGILSTTTGIFTIDNHFYNTGEELEYTPGSIITPGEFSRPTETP